MRTYLFSSAFFLSVLSGIASAELLSVHSAVIFVSATDNAIDNGISSESDSSVNTLFPYSDTLSATQGVSTSTATINWRENMENMELDFRFVQNFDNSPGGLRGDVANIFVEIEFTANENAAYEFIGGYEYAFSNGGGRSRLDGQLIDRTAELFLYLDTTESGYEGDASGDFTMGDINDGGVVGVGDTGAPPVRGLNANFGMPSGMLIAGQKYEFSFNASIRSRSGQTGDDRFNSVASATGFTTLIIEPAPVPLPAAVWLLGSTVIGLISLSGRKSAR